MAELDHLGRLDHREAGAGTVDNSQVDLELLESALARISDLDLPQRAVEYDRLLQDLNRQFESVVGQERLGS